MTDEPAGEVREDLPAPDLDDINQRMPAVPAVPVEIVGVPAFVRAPARKGAITADVVGTTQIKILDADPKRAAVTLVGTEAWLISSKAGGTRAPLPADVPIRIEHCGEVWAVVASGSATITAIIEVWAE